MVTNFFVTLFTKLIYNKARLAGWCMKTKFEGVNHSFMPKTKTSPLIGRNPNRKLRAWVETRLIKRSVPGNYCYYCGQKLSIHPEKNDLDCFYLVDRHCSNDRFVGYAHNYDCTRKPPTDNEGVSNGR